MSGRLAITAAATILATGFLSSASEANWGHSPPRLLLNALLPRIAAQLRLKDAVAVPAAAALPIEAPHADWGIFYRSAT